MVLMYFLLFLMVLSVVFATTFVAYENVYFLPEWSNGIYKTQNIFTSSLIFCAAICNSEMGGQCSFYFLNYDTCYLGNLVLISSTFYVQLLHL